MKGSGSASSYRRLARDLAARHGHEAAMSMAVGGNFEAVGIIERELLFQHGLRPDDYLVDVGCGSGRLAAALSAAAWPGPYLGLDVVPELLEHARAASRRPDWRFELTDGASIPEGDSRAGMVCFFSVLTHLPHEQSYLYLREARRVLEPGGAVVFSFLEFRIPDHWALFEPRLADAGGDPPLVMFLGRDGIEAWAGRLGLEVAAMIDGNVPHVPIPHPLTFDDGTTVAGTARLGPIGQSVCVLRKPAPWDNPAASSER